MTCARTRPYGNQDLSQDFFIKEHTKSLFNGLKILNLRNLYFYHCTIETYKIFKYNSPITLFDKFKFSKRSHKDLFIITPTPSASFIYRASVIWNMARQILSIKDTSIPVSCLKEHIKQHLLRLQATGDTYHWLDCNFIPTSSS